MNTLTISAIFCAFAAGALGIVTSSKSLKDKQYQWFSILCGLITFWNLSFFFSRIFYSLLFERFYLLTTLLLGPTSLYFFIQFVGDIDKTKHQFKKRTLITLFVGAILSLGVFLTPDYLFWFKYAANSYTVLLCGYAFYLLIRYLQTSKLGVNEKRRHLYFISAGLITLLSLILDGFSEAGFSAPAVGNVVLIFYLYFVYQTITKQKVLDIEDLTAKGVLFFVFSAILTCIYAVLVSWVEGPALFIFNTFVASFVILILFEPLKSLIEKATYQFFLQSKLETEKKLVELQSRLTESADIQDLSHELVMGLKNAFSVTQAHFFLMDHDGIKFKLIKSLEPDLSKIATTEIPIGHDFTKYLQRCHPRPANIHFVNQEILERGRSSPKERLENILKMFQSLSADVAFGFMVEGKLAGFCTLINEKSETPYSLSDFELLVPLSRRVANALKNLEVYDRIRQRDRLATVGEMAAGLAHEIRNPLGAIKGAAQYLQPTTDDTQQNEFLRVIIDEVNRLNKVVTEFLDYAKPQAHQVTETDLAELLKKTLHTLASQIPSNITLTTNISTNQPYALVDAQQIQQVFINLILNALQAMPKGGQLRASLSTLKGHIEVRIEDTGVGISEEEQKKLFIPFFTTRDSGFGLGLPISQKIIRAHHGSIQVESELRKGTKFIIRLPRKES